MVTRIIYCEPDKIEYVKTTLDDIIANDRRITINKWELNRTSKVTYFDIELGSQRDWIALKEKYFPVYRRRALPECITLE